MSLLLLLTAASGVAPPLVATGRYVEPTAGVSGAVGGGAGVGGLVEPKDDG